MTLDSSVNFMNSSSAIIINKNYQRFILKNGSVVVDNIEQSFLSNKSKNAVRVDITQFNDTAFTFLTTAITNATAGSLTAEQVEIFNALTPVEPVAEGVVRITEISDSASYVCEYVEIYNGTNSAIDVSTWTLEEDRRDSITSTTNTEVQLSSTLESKGFLIVTRSASEELLESTFGISLGADVLVFNSNGNLIINKTYERFVLKDGSEIIDNLEMEYLANKNKVAVRTDFTIFNESAFYMGSTSEATPGNLTSEQADLLNSSGSTPVEPVLEPYYASTEGLSGNSLKSALNNIIKGHTVFSYSNAWTALRETDDDPNNSNNFILLYTGRSLPKTEAYPSWNREHVWAKSHGDFGTANGPGTDLHHLRPADVSVNGDRSNKDFDLGGIEHTEAIGNYTDSDSWEPRDEVKGDVARMIFYMAVRYEVTDSYVDLEVVEGVNTGINGEPEHGNLSILKQWNDMDPVSDFERNRNDIIYNNWQRNRNPFIDHPEWVEVIW